jgi:hypothetical protein
MDPEQVPIKTFDPLLRDLLHWGLLVRAEDPSGTHWQLAERTEQRLNDLASETRAFSAERMVFLDHSCGECGLRRLTRLRDSRYICDACWNGLSQPSAVEAVSAPAPAPEPAPIGDISSNPLREHRWNPPWRQRTA